MEGYEDCVPHNEFKYQDTFSKEMAAFSPAADACMLTESKYPGFSKHSLMEFFRKQREAYYGSESVICVHSGQEKM